MVRPRLYGRGDIHNRELRYGRIAPFGGFTCFTKNFHERALRWEMRGSHFIEKLSPKKFGENFVAQAILGVEGPLSDTDTFPHSP